MTRAFRQDEWILDRAAALFAQHGFAHTSVQSLADAVGLSKAGLLHHFPSKETLHEAATAMGREHTRRLLDQVTPLPPGRDRDRLAVELLTDFALDRPGLVALASRSITSLGVAKTGGPGIGEAFVFEMFDVAPDQGDSARLARVIGMLGALVVLSLVATHQGDRTTWRRHIVATCLDALGSPEHPDQVEA
ncbi:TetR/AcrR family transcriptional regulator [Actinokineospora inagensis]|uniref:TetR/AcrR family transcriptional regulator n=1 Tax=Actinokineospora inagensis TaxID=103730 RepID=UPI00041B7D59|nr:helix-turn-helix domain-containing protein [Actinokineospora inagensis]